MELPEIHGDYPPMIGISTDEWTIEFKAMNGIFCDIYIYIYSMIYIATRYGMMMVKPTTMGDVP